METKYAINKYINVTTEKIVPNKKLSGLKICPNGPERTESMVPGSKSTKTARGTYFPPKMLQFTVSYYKFSVTSVYTLHWKLVNFASQVVLPSCFVVIDVYSFQLKVRVAMICAGRVNTVLVRYDFPKLKERVPL